MTDSLLQKQIIFIALIFSFLTLKTHASVRLQTSLNPQEATMGDRLTLKVSAYSKTDVSWVPPKEKEFFLPFELFEFKPTKSIKNGDQFVQEFNYTLIAFDVGVSTIPSLSFTYKDSKNNKEIKTPEIPITIRSLLPPEAKEFIDRKGKLIVPHNYLWLWILISLFLMGLIIFYIRRRYQNQKIVAAENLVPAHETALKAIAKLENHLQEPSKQFYSRLSDIFRLYLEQRFHIAAMDQTTSEIHFSMKKCPIALENKQLSRDVLEISDLAKFAKLNTSQEERMEHISAIKTFILDTKPAKEIAKTKMEMAKH